MALLIIDITRSFSNEQYLEYVDIINRWWVQHDGDLYNYLNYLSSPPPEEVKEDIINNNGHRESCAVREDELELLKSLKDKFNKVVKLLSQNKNNPYPYVKHIHTESTNLLTALTWLERKSIAYYYIIAPHPDQSSIFLLKDKKKFEEFKIVAFAHAPNLAELTFLENEASWKWCNRNDGMTASDILNWCNEMCIGAYKVIYNTAFDPYLTRSTQLIYFELESDLILYRMTF